MSHSSSHFVSDAGESDLSEPARGGGTATSHPIGVDPGLINAFLGNVAIAIDNVLIPELSGSARARAAECVGILNRSLQSLATPAPVAVAPLSGPESWKAAAAEEGALLDAYEAAALAAGQQTAAGGAAGRSFDPLRFEQYLRGQALGGAAVKVQSYRQLPGGRSKQTILVSLEAAAGLPRDIVVRQDWASAVTGTSVVSEFELLKRVAEAGLRVPQPLLLEKSTEALGAPFLVVTRMDGGPQGDIFNPPPSEALALQVAEQLAWLHRLPAEDFTGLGVATEAYTPEQLEAGLAGFRALHDKLGAGSRTINIAIAWLGEHLSAGSVGPKAVVHNDLGCHNFLIDGERLTAILDWELANIGNPAADLGYIRDWIGKMIAWPKFMEAYYAAGAPPVDPATLDFFTLWCGVRLYCLLLQARAGVAMGMIKDTEITFAVAQFVPKLLHRISRQLRAILERPAAAA